MLNCRVKHITSSSIVVVIEFPWITLGRNCDILFIPGMIKLGSENFPVTYLKSTNYLILVSCVNQKLWSLSHLIMLNCRVKHITSSSIVVVIQFPWIILGRNCHILFIPGMIKLGSENFTATYLKSANYFNLVSYCVSRKLISLSHLSMLTSYKFRILVAFWAPFDLYSALKKLNTCIILLNAWQHRISHKTLSARANL